MKYGEHWYAVCCNTVRRELWSKKRVPRAANHLAHDPRVINITPSNDRETLPSPKAIRAYLPGKNGLAGTKLTDDHHSVCQATIPIFRSLNMMQPVGVAICSLSRVKVSIVQCSLNISSVWEMRADSGR
jgi:hypothetical protein